MGTPLANQTVSGYNSAPPADDGSVTAANKVKWATIKTQLSDPLNSFDAAINTALRTALNVTATSQSSAYTTTTADHIRPIEVTGTTTISLGDAATMVAASMGYSVPIINRGVGTVTVTRITGTDTLDGATKDIKLSPGQGAICSVNSTSNGYNITAVANGVIFDPTDPSKQIKFDLSNLTTGTVRTITVLDGDASLGWTTGDVKLTIKTTADVGWVLMNDGTIGDASSGGTTRANADTSALFTLLWNNTSNTDCPVSSGRGASAAADFAAHKTITLPKALGRALAVYGSGSGLTARTMGQSFGAETLPAHTHGPGGGNAFIDTQTGAGGSGFGAGTDLITRDATTGSTGTGTHGVMQPTVFLNVMIKL